MADRRLGRGLGSLLGGTARAAVSDNQEGASGGVDPSAGSTSAQEGVAADGSPKEVSVDCIRPNPHQPRKVFEDEALEELRDSIARHGILQPICVRRVAGIAEAYEIISGERRWRASRLAERRTIPVVVREHVPDEEMLELALVENLQRADLDPREKAQGYADLMGRLGLTQEQVAQRVGLRRSSVANQMRLLELPPKVQEALREGLVSMGHARAMLGLRDERKLHELLGRIVREGLSVRQVEDAVRAELKPAHTQSAAAATSSSAKRPEPWVTAMQDRMREKLGTRIRIENQDGYRGRIVIEYHDRGELDRLFEHLAPTDRI